MQKVFSRNVENVAKVAKGERGVALELKVCEMMRWSLTNGLPYHVM